MKVEFFKHNVDEADIARVVEVLHSTFLTTASVTAAFEKQLAAYLRCEEVVALSSCTAALHLALLALDIGPGDEVITTPMSFIATANAILHAGAVPVFVDVEPDTGNIDATRIEAAITPKTKAIMPVHLYGNMADMRAIKKIADAHSLKVIEDAAHCIEGERDGIRVGELGDMACFSFYATKNITSGEGGAVSCHDEATAQRLKRLRLHGMSKDAASRYGGKYKHWDMVELGWKYNTTDIQSALLLGQLEQIDTRLHRRQTLAQNYHDAFSAAGISHIWHSVSTHSAYHLFTILSDKRERLLETLQEKNIGVAVNYNPIHLTTYYRETFGYKAGDFPIAESIGAQTLSIPLYPQLSDDEQAYVIQALLEASKG